MNDFAFSAGTVDQASGMVAFGDDKRLFVQFYTRSVQNNYQSDQQGRPVFEARPFVKIVQPGERDVIDREVREEDKYRFRVQWERYEAQQEQTPTGTPLAVLYPSEPHIVDQMQALKIFTAEQLAGLTEQAISRLGMGGRAHVERAKKFIEAAEKFGGAHQMQRELDAANDRIAALEGQIAQLLAAAPKRGRPPKNADDEGD
jgi:hypothetical protein